MKTKLFVIAVLLGIGCQGVRAMSTDDYLSKVEGMTDASPKEARVLAKQWVKEFPNDDLAWEDLGIIEFRLKHYPEAVRCLTKSIEIDPNGGDVWKELSEAYLAMGDPSKALDAITESLKHGSKNASAWAVLAKICIIGKDKEHAELALAAIKNIDPSNPNIPTLTKQINGMAGE